MVKQPKEMYMLSVIEMCQRFAFYGIASLLVLYLVKYHRLADASATELYGIFTGAAFVLPLLGGFIADRTSYKWSVVVGSLCTALGCFLLATGLSSLLYYALLFVAIGTGLFTPSIYTLLGAVYRSNHHLREGGFSIYYAAVNIGAFIATFALGTLGQANFWGVAFSIAGLVQLFGLWVFLRLMKSPKFVNFHGERQMTNFKTGQHLKKQEISRIVVICVLSFVSILFWMAYNQGWSSMSLFGLRYTDRHIGHFEMPTAWLFSLENLYLIALAFPLAAFYAWLAKRKWDPSPPMKLALALIAMGICFGIMLIGSKGIREGANSASVSAFYLVFAYFFMALGEMLLTPIGLALITHLSPRRYSAFLVGIWYVCIGIGFYLGGHVAGMMSKMKISSYFDMFTLALFIVAAILLFFVKKLNKLRHTQSL